MDSILAKLGKARADEPTVQHFGREDPVTSPEVETGWHLVLSDLVHLADTEELLIESVRKGFARHLRGRPQLQAEVVTYLDVHIRDDARRGTLLMNYVQCNFGELTPPRTRRRMLEAALPLLDVCFYLWPGLAALLVMCSKQAGRYHFKALSAAARRLNRPSLAQLAELIRKDQTRHVLGMSALLEVAPVRSWICRFLVRILVRLWHADLKLGFEGPVDPESRNGYRSIGFDAPWFLSRLDYIQQQMLTHYAMRAHGADALPREQERMAM